MNNNTGKVANINKYGIFVNMGQNKTGLARWSKTIKGHKYHVGEIVAFKILEELDSGKIDLELVEEDFQEKYEKFLLEASDRLQVLDEKNKDIRKFL